MKIKMLTILAGVAMAYPSLSQSDSLVITDSTAWNQLFAPLIPHSSAGIIPQTTLSNIPWERLTGNLQLEIEPVAPALFNQIVTTLNEANLSGSYTTYSSARDNFKTAIATSVEIPIVMLDLNYDVFRHDDTNLIRYDTLSESLILNDVNQDSIFYTESLFLAAVPDSFYADGLSLVLDSNHYYSNKGAKPNNFQLSFDDGQTWDTYNWGSTIPIGAGNAENILLKADYGGGLVKSSKFRLNTFSCANSSVPSPALAPWNSNPNQFENGNITASYSQSFTLPAVGNAYTWFRDNTLPGEENLYKKPIVIVEGIDFGDHNTQNASNFRMGDFGWCALWGNNPGYPLQKMPTMLNDLHAEAYDIIMLDFKDGDYYIQDNAFLLATLLEKINSYKTADAEATVVLGASMGGIVARYALRWMEMNNKPACARMLMTLDSPHQGAYVPLFLTALIVGPVCSLKTRTKW
jgi:pimeloyl-ACP methyl ester carboxylesterase